MNRNNEVKPDELWFRTKEQKVLEEIHTYKNIDMSKSSRKNGGVGRQDNYDGDLKFESVEAVPSLIGTKFNYGTNTNYNPRLSQGFGSNALEVGHQSAKSNQPEANPSAVYDPTDIDALLRHNEHLLSKIKMDMKHIGESFVSQTDMGNSRVRNTNA